MYCDAGRATYRVKLKLHGAWVFVPTGTRNEELARGYDATLSTCLANGLTDVVEAVKQKQVPLSLVHQELTLHGVSQVRSRLADRARSTDLKALIQVWVDECRKRGAPAPVTLKAYQVCLERLTAGRGALTESQLTVAWINERLADTVNARKSYSALRIWVRWLVRRGVIRGGILEGVQPPPVPKPRERWLDSGKVRALLEKAEPRYRNALAIAYATGAEASPLCALKTSDVDVEQKAIYIAGTKTAYRARWVPVGEWAWGYVEDALQSADVDTGALFPGMDRWSISQAHRDAAEAIDEHGLRLHDARHTFAVRMAKAGVPLSVIASLLGHGDSVQVSRVYSKYQVDLQEKRRWENVAAAAGEW